jgi:hypothetical protein
MQYKEEEFFNYDETIDDDDYEDYIPPPKHVLRRG